MRRRAVRLRDVAQHVTGSKLLAGFCCRACRGESDSPCHCIDPVEEDPLPATRTSAAESERAAQLEGSPRDPGPQGSHDGKQLATCEPELSGALVSVEALLPGGFGGSPGSCEAGERERETFQFPFLLGGSWAWLSGASASRSRSAGPCERWSASGRDLA